MKLDQNVISLIKERSFGHVAMIDSDGFPHVTPVWVDTDGERIIINTAVGTKKQRLARAGIPVSVEISNPSNPYRYVLVKGRVAEQTEKGADEHINKMSLKYTGNGQYQKSSPDEKRVIIYIEPLKVIGNY